MSEYSKRNVRSRKAQKEQDYVQDFERLFDKDCYKEKRPKEDPPSECLDLLSAELLDITEVIDVPGRRMTEYRKAKTARRTRQMEEDYALEYHHLFDENYRKQKCSKKDPPSECLDLLSTQLLERTEVMDVPVKTMSGCSKQELKSGNKQKVQMPLEEADCVIVHEHFEEQPPQEETGSECEDNTSALELESDEVLEVPGTDEDSNEEELTLLRAAEEPRDILDYID